MTIVLVALVVGGAAGLARGGRLTNLADAHLRSLMLLVVGAAGQLAVGLGSLRGALGFSLIVASYVALSGFAARNLAIAGMGVVVLGVALNLAPIVADQGMPVESGAIVRAGIAPSEGIATLSYGGKRHLAHPGDHLRLLDDAIPEWATHEVLSVGDLVIGAGVGAVVTTLVRGRRSVRSGRSPGGASSGGGSDRPAID